jgi:hypothetical protein
MSTDTLPRTHALCALLDRHARVEGEGSVNMGSMRRQKRFERERKYPAKTYAEAAAEVYFNDEYMANNYLPGLLLSHDLWPHHFQQLEYFPSFFLATLHRRRRAAGAGRHRSGVALGGGAVSQSRRVTSASA